MYEQVKKENRNKINAYIQGQNGGRVDFFPAYIQLEQTNRCNASCIMCNHFYLGNNGASDIDEDVLSRVYDILPYCETLMLNGDGEPFLCGNIVDNIRTYAKYEVKIGTNTNFGYVPQECFELFAESFGFLNISCDGAKKETFELIRSGLSYEKFVENINKLNQIAPKLPKNLDCVVMIENIEEVSDIVRFAADNGFRSVRFNRMGVNPCIGNEADSDLEFLAHAYHRLSEAKKLADELGIIIQIPGYPMEIVNADYDGKLLVNNLSRDNASYGKQFDKTTIEIGDLVQLISDRKKTAIEKYGHLSLSSDYYSEAVSMNELKSDIWESGKPCQWATERLYIDLKGNVSTCCFNIRKNMGNLHDNTFEEIWNGEKYLALRTLMGKNCLPKWCKTCNWIEKGRF